MGTSSSSEELGAGADRQVPGSGLWRPIESAPEHIIAQATFYPPKLGDWVFKLFWDVRGNSGMWVVQFDNPSGKAVRALRLPMPDGFGEAPTTPPQVATPAV